ncbi:MAG TPA: 6-phosphogluconolactonase [Myxococcota bacterium]|nr:6-phosphogluconolactonase [Myxococcota bacterium]
MQLEVLPDAESVARRAAERIAAEARAAIGVRGHFSLAVSGGHTPWQMLRFLADQEIPWEAVHLFQVDERVAPAGDSDRNLTHITESLLRHVPLAPGHVHAMPVEDRDLAGAAARYAGALDQVVGAPAVLDLVHLGLGPDGHTASLVPGDPVLEVTQAEVAIAGPYQGHRRMTLTFPVLDRARRVLWVVTGAEKAGMLARLQAGDRSVPAGRVSGDRALVLADQAAAPGKPLKR